MIMTLEPVLIINHESKANINAVPVTFTVTNA